MYKNILLLLINSMLISTISQAQGVSWGNGEKTFKASGTLTSLGWHDGFLYNIEREDALNLNMGGELRLEKLSDKLELTLSKELDEAKCINFTTDHYEIQGDEIIVYNVYNAYEKQLIIEAIRFDLNGVFKEKEELISLKYENIKTTTVGFSSSPDRNLVNFIMTSTDKSENKVEITSLVFNLTKNAEYTRADQVFRLENNMDYVRVLDTYIDNTGNSFVVLRTRGNFNSGVEKSHLLIINQDGEYLLNKTLDFDGFFLTQVKFKISENNHAYFTGMLSTTNDNGKTMNNGFFLADIDQNKYEIGSFKSFVYDEEFFLSLGYKIKKNGKVKFNGFYTLDILLDKKGGGYLVANHYENLSMTVANREMVVFSFDEELNIDKPKVVLRSLKADARLMNGLGYFGFIKDMVLYLVYSDHKKNIDVNTSDDLVEADNPNDNKTKIFCAKIESGEPVIRSVISEENSIKGYLIPEKCQASDKKAIINVGNKSKTLYGEVKF